MQNNDLSMNVTLFSYLFLTLKLLCEQKLLSCMGLALTKRDRQGTRTTLQMLKAMQELKPLLAGYFKIEVVTGSKINKNFFHETKKKIVSLEYKCFVVQLQQRHTHFNNRPSSITREIVLVGFCVFIE